MAVNAEFFSAAFSSRFWNSKENHLSNNEGRPKKKTNLYSRRKMFQPKSRSQWENILQLKKFSIFKFIYFYVDFIFREAFKTSHRERKQHKNNCSKCRLMSIFAKPRERKKRRSSEGNKRFTLNWLSFKCLWFFINFAVAFHPLSMFGVDESRDVYIKIFANRRDIVVVVFEARERS